MRNIIKAQDGQAMILSIVLLGALLLSASAIAGLLTIFQIRQANNVVNSTKAIFAADAALEWATYACYSQNLCDPNYQGDLVLEGEEAIKPIFENGLEFNVYQYSVDANNRWKFSAEGKYKNSIRLLEVTFGKQL
jgi:hypothetical protein